MLVLALVGAACGGDDEEPSDGTGATGETGSTGSTGSEDLTGTITISGSSTVEPISSLVAELFNEIQPGVAISVDGPGHR